MEQVMNIGGCSVLDLVQTYQTPLYVVDEEQVRKQCRMFKKYFSDQEVETDVLYASKAFLNVAMCKLINEEHLSLDVVSGGELYTALKAKFPPSNIYMHGNNKSYEELLLAIKVGVGHIVVDHEFEFEMIEQICKEHNQKVNILLRVNPGVYAHTHEYIQTAKNDSKFGISIYSEEVLQLIKKMNESANVNLLGFHYHIGSQIFDVTPFYEGISIMMNFIKTIHLRLGYQTRTLNLGGGFGVQYTKEDDPMSLDILLKGMIDVVKKEAIKYELKLPKLLIEPGRSIVANAGITLYTIGSIKNTFGGKNYIFIDGGMTDNPRHALYEAKYDAVIANKLNEKKDTLYTVAGKCCESGDLIIKDLLLPNAQKNDILAVLGTGAYNYSMSSNYNRLVKPAVIFVSNGASRVVVKRETYDDIIRNDMF